MISNNGAGKLSYFKNLSIVWCLFLVPAAMLSVSVAASDREQDNSEEKLITVELSTIGMDMVTRTPVVILQDTASQRIVPIWVGLAEAQAIAWSLHGIKAPRPMTHDLMANMLSELNAVVEEVVVHDLREGTYYGRIQLRVEGDTVVTYTIDSRPSDAMALALRSGATIRVAEHIFAEIPQMDFRPPEGPQQVVRLLGMTVVMATAELRAEHGLPADQAGVVVRSATGPAEEAGLRPGDFIVRVNDTEPGNPMAFFDAAREAMGTGSVRVTYWREGREHTVTLRPQLQPPLPGEEVIDM